MIKKFLSLFKKSPFDYAQGDIALMNKCQSERSRGLLIKKFLSAVLFLCFINFLIAQNPEKPRLITGPVVGSVTKNSARIWIAYKGDGQNIMWLIDTVDKTTYRPTGFSKINDSK